MTFSFAHVEMIDDLRSIAKAGSPFFAPQSVNRVERLATDLGNARATAEKSGDPSFNWQTPPGQPIQVRQSREWKGGTADFDPLSAEIEVDYACQLIEDDRLLAKGVTVVRIKDDGDAQKEKVFHFDVDPGGWHEFKDGKRFDRAGHPAFHMQFYGHVNDVPRLPSLIIHPVDVISLTILELHQKAWRDHLELVSTRSKLRKVPPRQLGRFQTTMSGWGALIGNSGFALPLVAMQKNFRSPLRF